jgi:ubiquinone/menaquinone biosynthesis C-methylase UbiE
VLGKKAYTGSIAETYEEDRISETIWEKEQQYIAGFVASLEGHETILDLPAGTGRYIPLYTAKGLHVIAADISSDMLEKARKKADGQDSVEFLVGDVENLTLEDNACDHVICWRLAHLIQPTVLERVLRLFARVARRTVRIQFFNVELEAGMLRRIAQKMKMLFRKPRTETNTVPGDASAVTPWEHIQVFTHSHRHILAASKNAGLLLVSVDAIEDERNPELIYVFTKTGQ